MNKDWVFIDIKESFR